MGLFGSSGGISYQSPDEFAGLLGLELQNAATIALFKLFGGSPLTGNGQSKVPGMNITYFEAFNQGLAIPTDPGEAGKKGTFVLAPTGDQLLQQAGKYQEKSTTQQIDLADKAYQQLFGENGPQALKNIAMESLGGFTSDKALNEAFGKIYEEALGPSSFAKTPGVQKFLGGPVLAKFLQLDHAVKKQAEGQALGLSGFAPPSAITAGLGSSLNFGTTGPFAMAGGQLAGINSSNTLAGSIAGGELGAANAAGGLGALSGIFGSAGGEGGWLSGLGDLFGGGGGGGGGGAGALAGVGSGFFKCWVADELYGVGSMRATLARAYAMSHDSLFLRIYGKRGKGWAAWLKRHPWAKPLVAPIWNRMWKKQARKLEAA